MSVQVPAGVRKEDSIILPPLQVGGRRQEVAVSLDQNCLAEKRLVTESQQQQHGLYRGVVRDHVAFPTACKPYFR